MRNVTSALLVLLAIACAAFAVPGLWFERHVVDPTGFVGMVSPVIRDAEVREQLVDDVTDAVMERSELTGLARTVAERVVEEAADQVVGSPEMAEAWVEVARRSHRLNVTDIAPPGLEGRFALDLTPIVEVVVAQANRSLGIDLPVGRDYLVLVGDTESRETFDQIRAATAYAPIVLVVGLVAALLAVVLGRRRGVVLLALGAGLIGVALASVGILRAAWDRTLGEETTAVATAVLDPFTDEALASYDTWALGLGALGFVLAALGVVLLVRRPRSRDRPQTPPGAAPAP